jgi:hypothetical protein
LKHLRKEEIGENSLVSLSVFESLPVGGASRKGWKIFINGVKPLLGHSIPVVDSMLDHGFVRLQPCLLLIKVRFFGNVGL